MIPDTTSAREYWSERPDWGEAYSFGLEFVTNVTATKDGSEQRARRRNKPRYRITYSITGIKVAKLSVYRARFMRLVSRPVSVPIWHVSETLNGILGDQISLTTGNGLFVKQSPFKAGGLIYFTHPTFGDCWRRIVSTQGETVINLKPGNAEFPNAPMPAYPAGTRAYPVIDGLIDTEASRFNSVDVFTTSLNFELYEN